MIQAECDKDGSGIGGKGGAEAVDTAKVEIIEDIKRILLMSRTPDICFFQGQDGIFHWTVLWCWNHDDSQPQLPDLSSIPEWRQAFLLRCSLLSQLSHYLWTAGTSIITKPFLQFGDACCQITAHSDHLSYTTIFWVNCTLTTCHYIYTRVCVYTNVCIYICLFLGQINIWSPESDYFNIWYRSLC